MTLSNRFLKWAGAMFAGALAATSALAADIDIDESAGVEHGFEVIRNATFKDRTNPYQIHEFLLISDPVEKTLDPGYTFVF